MSWLGYYLAAVNLLLLALMGADKRRAKSGRWRISEGTLLALALLGGSLGGILGMALFHHKTSKTRFSLGLPLIFAAELIAAMYLLGYHLP